MLHHDAKNHVLEPYHLKALSLSLYRNLGILGRCTLGSLSFVEWQALPTKHSDIVQTK